MIAKFVYLYHIDVAYWLQFQQVLKSSLQGSHSVLCYITFVYCHLKSVLDLLS